MEMASLMGENAPDAGERVKSLYGSDLRSVIYLHEDGRDVLYLRDDVDGSAERLSSAFETLMMDVMSAPVDEVTFPHGDLRCVTRRFEEAVELHFPLSETEGAALALDGDATETYEPSIGRLQRILEDSL